MRAYSVQVKSVWPGKIGGAIFKANVLGESLCVTCKAKYKVMDRIPEVGEIWKVTGTVVNHHEHGPQLNIIEAFVISLPSPSYLEALLINHPAFRGFHFGKSKISSLIRRFGSDALSEILQNSDVVQLSTALDTAIANKLVAAWHSLSNEIETLNFLREHRFSMDLSKQILKISKYNTVARLKSNPYSLVCFHNMSEKNWRTIEATAKRLKIPSEDARRLAGAVEYVLYKRLADGHTATPVSVVMHALYQIPLKADLADQAIHQSLKQKIICAFSKNSETYLQLISVAYIEHSIEIKISALLTSPASQQTRDLVGRTIKSYARAFFTEYNYYLSSQQEIAIQTALTERCTVLSGFGGTGKTTTLKALGDICFSLGRPLLLVALSGKAKERMAQVTGRNAMTIHAFLIGLKNGSVRIDSDPLLVVDEASMVDPTLFNRLLCAFGDSPYSLLMVGDTTQLSPIGFGLVWHRMVKSNQIKAVHLTEVYRQVSGSPLHSEAMLVRKGDSSELQIYTNQDKGIFLEEANISTLLQKITKLKVIHSDAQILTPFVSGKTADSTRIINVTLQEHLNPFNSSQFNIPINDFLIRKHDPIIFTKNSYDLNVFNGTTGIVEDVFLERDQKRVAKIRFSDSEETQLFSESDLNEAGAELAYAISIHKSQGSEYSKVIVCCIRDTSFIERSLIYTAITRAKNLCIVVGSQSIYSKAVASPPRATTLCVGLSI